MSRASQWNALLIQHYFSFFKFGCSHNSCAGELPRSASRPFFFKTVDMLTSFLIIFLFCWGFWKSQCQFAVGLIVMGKGDMIKINTCVGHQQLSEINKFTANTSYMLSCFCVFLCELLKSMYLATNVCQSWKNRWNIFGSANKLFGSGRINQQLSLKNQ